MAPNAVIQRMKEDSAQMGRVAPEAELVTVILFSNAANLTTTIGVEKRVRETTDYSMKNDTSAAEQMTPMRSLILIPLGMKFDAQKACWSSSKYSAIAGQAMRTKMNLQAVYGCPQQQFKDINENDTCPLCKNVIKTLEHMLSGYV